jgi:hypothetical protein
MNDENQHHRSYIKNHDQTITAPLLDTSSSSSHDLRRCHIASIVDLSANSNESKTNISGGNFTRHQQSCVPSTLALQHQTVHNTTRSLRTSNPYEYVEYTSCKPATSARKTHRALHMDYTPPRPAPYPKNFEGIKEQSFVSCSLMPHWDSCQNCGRKLRRVVGGPSDMDMYVPLLPISA